MPHKPLYEPGVGTGQFTRVKRERTCADCGASFMAHRSDALRCPDCKLKARRADGRRCDQRTKYDTCPKCGARKYKKAVGCIHCRNKEWKGERNPNWKGGRTVSEGGYVMLYQHAGHGARRYRGEHIVVWEQAHGPIPHAWHVHHLNGVKTDNRLENLIALSNQAHHTHPYEARKPYEERIRVLEQRLLSAGLPID